MADWKVGDEFAPYHPQASHVNPDWRDGWNACHTQAAALLRQQAERIAELEGERDQLRAEVERLRVDAERWTALRASNFQMVMHSKGKRVFWSVRPVFTNYEYSLFDSQDQAVDSLRNEQKGQP